MAGHGSARLGPVWQGSAGMARQGSAGLVQAGLGKGKRRLRVPFLFSPRIGGYPPPRLCARSLRGGINPLEISRNVPYIGSVADAAGLKYVTRRQRHIKPLLAEGFFVSGSGSISFRYNGEGLRFGFSDRQLQNELIAHGAPVGIEPAGFVLQCGHAYGSNNYGVGAQSGFELINHVLDGIAVFSSAVVMVPSDIYHRRAFQAGQPELRPAAIDPRKLVLGEDTYVNGVNSYSGRDFC
jgi:hypothetical protein